MASEADLTMMMSEAESFRDDLDSEQDFQQEVQDLPDNDDFEHEGLLPDDLPRGGDSDMDGFSDDNLST